MVPTGLEIEVGDNVFDQADGFFAFAEQHGADAVKPSSNLLKHSVPTVENGFDDRRIFGPTVEHPRDLLEKRRALGVERLFRNKLAIERDGI
jgi:hypothetical protein